MPDSNVLPALGLSRLARTGRSEIWLIAALLLAGFISLPPQCHRLRDDWNAGPHNRHTRARKFGGFSGERTSRYQRSRKGVMQLQWHFGLSGEAP
jgi:hypothetical protein